MTWLQGGPFYELSFLLKNSNDKKRIIDELITQIFSIDVIHLVTSENEIESLKEHYVGGELDGKIIHRTIDVDTSIEVAGLRKSRLHIQELSTELLKLNLWFYGSKFDVDEWNQIGLKKADKPKFRLLFNLRN